MIVTRDSYRFFIQTMQRTGHSASQIYRLLQKAWQEMAPSRATVFRLFRELEDGTRNSFQDAPQEGRPVKACSQANITILIIQQQFYWCDSCFD